MSYIDGVVAAVPTARKDQYVAYCRAIAKVFRRHGALAVHDAWGADVPPGKQTDFYRAVQAAPEETVTIGWIIWADKAAREKGWAGVMEDPDMHANQMPFDGKRMIYGGFDTISEG